MLLCCLVLKISRLLFPSHGSQNLKCTCAASMKLRTLLFQSSSHGKDQSVVLQNTFYKGCDAPHQSTRQKRKSHAEQISDVRVLMPYHLVRSICLHESSLPMTVTSNCCFVGPKAVNIQPCVSVILIQTLHLLKVSSAKRNGQWSMPARHKANPFLGTGGENKHYIMYIVLDRLPSHQAEIVKLIKECNPMLVEFRLLQP